MELTVLFPCLNEEKTVAVCVRQAAAFFMRNHLSGEVLVVDNGSDDSSVIAAQKAGARVISCPQKGYGNALRYGITAALGKYVIMGDCDCSYQFDDLMPFIEELRHGADMVIGNRFAMPMEPKAMPFAHKYFGVPLLSFLGRICCRTNVKDFHCGLRAVNKESFLGLGCCSEGMEFATEMIGKASIQGQKITQLPVKLYVDKRGRKSHLRTIRDGFRHLKMLIVIMIKNYRFYKE